MGPPTSWPSLYKFYTAQVVMLHPSISGIHGFPPLLLPQLRRARHLQEEAHARQGPASGVRDEGEEITEK